MSFSKDTKSELCKAEIPDQVCRQALVYGMVLFSRIFTSSELSFSTGSRAAAGVYAEQLSVLTGVIVDMEVRLTRRSGESSVYKLSIPDSRDCARIYDYFGHDDKALSLRINRSNIDSEAAAAYFLRGAFLVCGHLSDPEKDYHLEFVVPHMNLAKDLSRVISEIEPIEAEPNIVRRKGSYIVYIKGSDQIADLLTYIGAPMASLELVQNRIYKSVRNKVNRQINSETANINKTAAASARQLQAIEKIRAAKGLSYLSDELRELAQLRLEHPEYNLRELSEALGGRISRSGVNHRLQRLTMIADEL